MIFATRYADSAVDYLIYLIFTLVAVCIALVLHEVAHGLVAKWNGDYTAKYSGRLSLNPLKHFDLIGFIMMMLVGFGYAKPVPVNPNNFKHYRRGLITVAIAGVIMNLILAFVSVMLWCLMWYAYKSATFGAASVGVINLCLYLMNFFAIFTSINLSLVFLIFCLFFRSTDFASWKRSLAAATGFARLCAPTVSIYFGAWWD